MGWDRGTSKECMDTLCLKGESKNLVKNRKYVVVEDSYGIR